MNAYKITVTLNVDSNISRSIIVPEGVTFKILHEIICIIFNLDENDKYQFIFEDIALIIRDTGSLNRDNIDSRFELVDDYLRRYSVIEYVNSFWQMNLNVSVTDYDVSYPQIIGIEGRFNPSDDIDSVDGYLDALKVEDKHDDDLLVRVNIMKIQELLLLLFNVPYAIESNEIVVLKEEETLNNLWDDEA